MEQIQSREGLVELGFQTQVTFYRQWVTVCLVEWQQWVTVGQAELGFQTFGNELSWKLIAFKNTCSHQNAIQHHAQPGNMQQKSETGA